MSVPDWYYGLGLEGPVLGLEILALTASPSVPSCFRETQHGCQFVLNIGRRPKGTLALLQLSE